MDEFIKVDCFFKKSTYEQMKKVVEFENSKNTIFKPERSSNNEVSDFVNGCVVTYLKRIYGQDNFIPFDHIGNSGKLKNKIKDYMERKGIKQKELSTLAQVDESNLSRILNNKSQPSLDNFLRIWTALDCPPLEEILYREIENEQ